MIEQLIAEATKFDFKVALKTNPPKNRLNLDRTDRRDYPEDAIRESLLNSIVHRDYSFSGSNLVNVYEDRIEFVSLGGLVSGLELESMPFRFSSQS